jgi:hypothetical protein
MTMRDTCARVGKGIDAGGFEDEILFIGKLKIIEELTNIL